MFYCNIRCYLGPPNGTLLNDYDGFSKCLVLCRDAAGLRPCTQIIVLCALHIIYSVRQHSFSEQH